MVINPGTLIIDKHVQTNQELCSVGRESKHDYDPCFLNPYDPQISTTKGGAIWPASDIVAKESIADSLQCNTAAEWDVTITKYRSGVYD